MRKQGSQIDDFFYATYHKTSKFNFTRKEKKLRKPDIGMIKLAQKKWLIDKKKSLVVGDQITDIKMAKKAFLKSILIKKEDDLFKIIKEYYRKASL